MKRPSGVADWSGRVQVSRFDCRDSVELNFCIRSEAGDGDFLSQAESIYATFSGELEAAGVRPVDVVAEKIFLSDLHSQAEPVRRVSDGFYERAGARAPGRALSIVGQPPVRAGQACELQALVVAPAGGGPPLGRPVEGLPAGAAGRAVDQGGLTRIHVSGITGGDAGDGLAFPEQARSAFRRLDAILSGEGLDIHDVVRTWIYLADIDRDYDALNQARREYFTARAVRPAPASTGIKGLVWPPDRTCGLDLLAVTSRQPLTIRTLHSPTMNEAPSYGSDFCRGMTVEAGGRRILYLSGTASIDTEGNVVSVNDIEGQVDRMLFNVEQLLAYEGASCADIVSAITYLKDASFGEAFRNVAAARGIEESFPNTLCVADVCRPEWLCEIETIAILG